MRLTKNITDKELFCKCTYPDCTHKQLFTQSQDLAQTIQDCVDHFARLNSRTVKVIINCANRCQQHNADVGGSPKSQHIEGIAADIVLIFGDGSKINPNDVASYFENRFIRSHGVGRYSSFTHIDIRKNTARWKS
jgi:uncharacterized protein YcbK (DUF882 family)